MRHSRSGTSEFRMECAMRMRLKVLRSVFEAAALSIQVKVSKDSDDEDSVSSPFSSNQ